MFYQTELMQKVERKKVAFIYSAKKKLFQKSFSQFPSVQY